MAGLSAVRACHEQPLRALESNVHFTLEILEALRDLTVRRFVFPSTGLVYEPSADRDVAETSATRAQSIYGATKLAAEEFVRAYFVAYGFHCGIARLSNVYGAGMVTESVIGKLFGQAIRGVPLSIRSGQAIRDFLYIEDAVDGMLAIARSLESPGCSVYNVSSGVGVAIGFIADAVARAFSISAKVLETDPEAIGAVSSLVLSNELLGRNLGWHPRYSLDSGLAASVEEFAKTIK
jgi:UDP-glucose 4-epimerase